ncbi:MAG: TIGR04086 family membrane protein [Clostridia bacterium]|nr:TIGR04086 family membrane protein [Clostridia bacterium]
MQNEFSGNIKKNLPLIIKGTIVGVGLTLISMVIFATIMLIFNLDRNLSVPFSTVSLAIGCFFAAIYTSKNIGRKGYLVGLIIGIIVFVMVTLISLIITSDGFSYNTLFHFIIILLSSVSGGIMGVNKNKKTRYI